MKDCKNCGCREFTTIITPEFVHYGKNICKGCGYFLGWAINPKKEGERNKTSKYSFEKICKFYNTEKPFCFFCLRTKDELPFNETLTRDHIRELDKEGVDELWNLQLLCSACHKLKNWARLYMNWHYKKDGVDKNDSEKVTE